MCQRLQINVTTMRLGDREEAPLTSTDSKLSLKDSPAVKPSASRCSVVAASCCAPGCKGRNTVDCKLTLHMCQVPAQVNGGGVTALGRLAKKAEVTHTHLAVCLTCGAG
ncbi:uncharacterized protein LOC126996671 isoform X1 [Eriocheir sinensis]|uniref:uncharacterized protein LOC126996671 isoform X1 n=1 Tax=Eriocheir sinensis TaxID=95602 RepID=UPI0021C97401|nr:uncharacterized protein LOC126996671 isoform X1 [Eriocheir sinensis]